MGTVAAGEADAGGPASGTTTAAGPHRTDAGPAGDAPARHRDADDASSDPRRDAAGRGPRPVHRWRDLSPRDRRWAVAVATALVLAPVAAFVHFLGDWAPTGDAALMGLRALDVGTGSTPLVGQPSASGIYTEGTGHVHHPGALHFYAMAVPVRLLGGAVGMPLVSVVITGASLLVAAWAVFRQLGRRAGLVAAGALAAAAFTTGASSLVDPVSSSIAGYPLLASILLVWCVAAGDVALLPAAAAAVSVTVLFHLAVAPVAVVVVAGGLGLAALTLRREGRWHDPGARRDRRLALRRAGAVSLVLWFPSILQQIFGDEGNLGQMLWFATHGDADTIGYGPAVDPVVRTLGYPFLLGRTDLSGYWLRTEPTGVGWVTAVAVAGAVALLGLRWRRTRPRRATLCAMCGVVALAGLVNTASVPLGPEVYRLPFYHWSIALATMIALVFGLVAADAVAASVRGRHRLLAPAVAGLAVVAVALPTLVDRRLDRYADLPVAAHGSVNRAAVEDLTGMVAARRDDLGDDPLLVTRNEPLYGGVREALGYALVEEGVDVEFSLFARFYVADDRLVDPAAIDSGLVFVVNDLLGDQAPPGGELLGRVSIGPSPDVDALRSLVGAADEVDEIELSPATERWLADLPSGEARDFVRLRAARLTEDPRSALLDPVLVEWLVEHPPLRPALAPDQLDALAASLRRLPPDDPGGIRTVDAYLLDREEILDVATPDEVGAAAG